MRASPYAAQFERSGLKVSMWKSTLKIIWFTLSRIFCVITVNPGIFAPIVSFRHWRECLAL
jgi:hypothetical protein